MSAPKRSFAVAGAVLTLAALPAAAQDLTIVSKVSHNDETPALTTSYVASSRMRMANPEGGEFMPDFASGQMTIIDNKKKQYYVVTRQEMQAAAAQMQARMKQMEEQMKDMPAAVREKMAGMMGGVAQAIDVQKGQGGRKIAGYTCENWVVTFGEMVRQEQCMTTELQYPVQVWDAQKDLAASMGGFGGPMGDGMGKIYEKFKEMKGMPLVSTSTTKILGKTSTTTTEVTEIKRSPIPASAWEIPAGYKKVDSPAAKMLK